jgi:hypothetical protein
MQQPTPKKKSCPDAMPHNGSFSSTKIRSTLSQSVGLSSELEFYKPFEKRRLNRAAAAASRRNERHFARQG